MDLKFVNSKGGGLLVALTGAIIVASIAFGPHLDGEYVWDDTFQVENNATLSQRDGYITILTKDLWGGSTGVSTQLYHPIPMLALWLQVQASGRSMVKFRLGNLAFHLCCCLLLYLLLYREGSPPLLAAAFTILFAVHPSVTEGVMWLTGRHDTMGAAFSLGALLAWPLGRGSSSWRQIVRRCLSGLCCALAFLCKEPYVVVPFMLATRELLLPGPGAEGRPARYKRALWLLLPFISIGCVFVLRRSLGISSSSAALFSSPLVHLMNFATIFKHYFIQIMSLSNGQTIESYTILPWGQALIVNSAIAGALAAGAYLTMRGSIEARKFLFGTVCFCLALAPHLLSLASIGMYANRYAYFPLGFTILVMAGLTTRLTQSISTRYQGALGLVALLLSLGLAFNTSAEAANWKDDFTLYGADMKASPEDPLVIYHFGYAVQRKHGCDSALKFFKRATEIYPRYWRAWHNVTGCLINIKDYRGAAEAGRIAAKLSPGNHRSMYNLGVALVYSGRPEEGARYLQRAVTLAPDYEPARKLLAQVKRQVRP